MGITVGTVWIEKSTQHKYKVDSVSLGMVHLRDMETKLWAQYRYIGEDEFLRNFEMFLPPCDHEWEKRPLFIGFYKKCKKCGKEE